MITMVNISAFFSLIKNFLLKPIETIRELKTKSYTYKDILTNILIFVVLVSFFYFLTVIFRGDFIGAILGFFFVLVIGLIGGFISLAIMAAIYYFFAKLLGGKPLGYVNFLYLYSLYSLIVGILSQILSIFINIILAPIPLLAFLGIILSLASILLFIYYFIILIRESFELSTLKALVVVIIPFIIFFLITVIFIGTVFLSIIGALQSMKPAL